jgi:hypothetical protein
MPDLVTAPVVARRIADALEQAGVPYAMGGAIALGLHAPPRATNDVDLNIFLDAGEAGPGLDALEKAGCSFDRNAAMESARAIGEFKASWRGMRVDVFVSSIDLHTKARGRVRTALLGGRPLKVLAPEDLAVLKLLYFRPKDIMDVELLVAFAGKTLDLDTIRTDLVAEVGDDDPRVDRWDEIVRQFGSRA